MGALACRMLVPAACVSICILGASSVRPGKGPGRALVVIGANDGTTGDSNVVREWLSYLVNHTSPEVPTTATGDLKVAVLVEANPDIYKRLQHTARTLFRGSPAVVPVLGLVSDSSAANLTFTSVDATRLLADCPNAPHWALYQLGSMTYQKTMKGFRGFLNPAFHKRWLKKTGKTFNCDLAAIRAHGDPKYYLKTMPVPVCNFKCVLGKGGLAPHEVDVLQVDVEGHDAEVVAHAFSSDPTFFPRVVIFEAKQLLGSVVNPIIAMLEGRGYTTNCRPATPELEGEAQNRCRNVADVIATHTQRGLYMGVPGAPRLGFY